MSGAAVRREQKPVHPSGVSSSWGRCSQRPPQVRSSALVQHVLFLQWVWLVLSLPPGAQGDGLHPTRRSVFSVLVFRPWVSMIGGQCLLFLQGVRTTCLSKNKVAYLEQQCVSKAGECSFSLKLTIFPKLYDDI